MEIVRYAIQVLLNDTGANHPRYVTRAVGRHPPGGRAGHPRGGREDLGDHARRRGVDAPPARRDRDWRQARESAGQTVAVVPVRMHPRMKTVPSRVAGPAADPPEQAARPDRASRA